MRNTCDPTREYVHWIHFIFGDCVYGTREASSVLLGYASIFCWLNAQLPQIVENYKFGSTDSLSLPFLLNWLLGDITNLVGCIILDQLPFQIYLAWYFCIVDFILLWQYLYYTCARPRQTELPAEEEHPRIPHQFNTFPRSKSEQAHRRTASIIFLAVLFLTFDQPSTKPVLSSPPVYGGMDKHSFPDWDKWEIPWPEVSTKMIGRIMAWTCAVLYLTSRMPQIFKNWSRESVKGLSISMFVFAALGNLAYSMSIVLNPSNNTSKALQEALPYLLGASGTLAFDTTIFLQWVYYGRLNTWRERQRQPIEMDIEERDRLLGEPEGGMDA